MILYHFTAGQLVAGAKRYGLKKGGILQIVNNTMILNGGYIWLTEEADPNKQSWATRHVVRYDRAEYRLTIDIPTDRENRLMDRDAVVKAFPGTEGLYDGWEGSDKWWVYKGIIFPEWIRCAEKVK